MSIFTQQVLTLISHIFITNRHYPYLFLWQFIMPAIIWGTLLTVISFLVPNTIIPMLPFEEFNPMDGIHIAREKCNIITYAPNNNPRVKYIFDHIMEVTDYSIETIGFPTVDEMQKQSLGKYSYTLLCAVEFPDVLTAEAMLPEDLTIKIRFPPDLRRRRANSTSDNWSTNSQYDRIKTFSMKYYIFDNHTLLPGYYREGFLAVQELIYEALAQFQQIGDEQNIGEKLLNITAYSRNSTIKMHAFPQPTYQFLTMHTSLFGYFGLLFVISFVMCAATFIMFLAMERESKLKFYFQTLGVTHLEYWTSWIIFGIIIFTIVNLIILAMHKIQIHDKIPPILPRSNAFALFIFWEAYSLAIISNCCSVSCLFDNAQFSVATESALFITSLLPFLALRWWNTDATIFANICSFIYPNCALGIGIDLIILLEQNKDGLSFENIFSAKEPVCGCTVGRLIIYLIVHSIGNFIFTFIVDMTFSNSGYLIIWKQLFTRKNVKIIKSNIPPSPYNQIFDEEIVLRCRNLRSATYRRNINDLNFDLYKNHVTSMVGANGCGKSLICNMISGIIQPVSGQVSIGDYDIYAKIDKRRCLIGYCPQFLINNSCLNIEEHLILICRLRGLTSLDAKQQIETFSRLLNMTKYLHTPLVKLSDDVQRKCNIAMAFAGNPQVVILDQPTANIDQLSKRNLLHFLHFCRNRCSILVVTYSMRCMEPITDRIIILNKGEIVCSGSKDFLNRQYNFGPVLRITKTTGDVDVRNITSLINQYIPTTSPDYDLNLSLRYIIPNDKADLLEQIAEQLKIYQKKLGISYLSISPCRYQEIHSLIGYTKVLPRVMNFKRYGTYSGNDLIWNKFHGLFLKHIYLAMHYKWMTALKFIIPVTYITLTMIGYVWPICLLPNHELSIASYNSPIILLSSDGSAQSEERIMLMEASIKDSYEYYICKNITETYINMTTNNPLQKLFILAGFDYNQREGDRIYFSPKILHSSAVALSTYNNLLIEKHPTHSYTVTMMNHPLPRRTFSYLTHEGLFSIFYEDLALSFSMAMSMHSANIVLVTSLERICGLKLMQLLSGTLVQYWFIYYIFEYVCYVFIVTMSCIPIYFILQIFLTDGSVTFAIYVVLLIQGFNVICASFISSLSTTQATSLMQGIVTGILISGLTHMLETQKSLHALQTFLTHPIVLIYSPEFNVYGILYKIIRLNIEQIYCRNMLKSCLRIRTEKTHRYIYDAYCKDRVNHDTEFCKDARNMSLPTYLNIVKNNISVSSSSYFQWSEPGVGDECFMLVISVFVNICYLGVLESNYLNHFTKRKKGYNDYHNEDSTIRAEKHRVRSYRPVMYKYPPVLIKNLTDYWDNIRTVNGFCLEAKTHECVTILGSNNSGIYSLFNMLTTQHHITRGNAYINGYNLKYDSTRAGIYYGYTPLMRNLCLIQLSPRKLIVILALLRGYTLQDSRNIALQLSTSFFYEDMLDVEVASLSRGIMKQISNSIAFISYPKVIMLFNPMNGLDVPSRQQLWRYTYQVKKRGHFVLIFTFDINTCDVFGDRVAIVIKDNIHYIGTMQFVVEKFAIGFYMLIILPSTLNLTELRADAEAYVKRHFRADLLQSQLTILFFHIKECHLTKTEIEQIMQRGKVFVPFEYYKISPPDFEQVFLDLCTLYY